MSGYESTIITRVRRDCDFQAIIYQLNVTTRKVGQHKIDNLPDHVIRTIDTAVKDLYLIEWHIYGEAKKAARLGTIIMIEVDVRKNEDDVDPNLDEELKGQAG